MIPKVLPVVLHLSTATDWRGGEQQVAYLCRALACMGVPQVLLCPAGAPLGTTLADTGITLVPFRKGAALDLLLARRLARVAREQDVQLVHTHDSHGHTAAVLANTFFGMALPLVVARRVDFPIHSGFSARWKYGHASVRRILCVSDAIRHITAQGLKDPAVLRTVRSGVDPARFNVEPDGRLRQQLGIGAGVPLVGCVAALAPHKDLATFIRTIARLRDRGSACHGVLIGTGELLPELQALTRQLRLEDRLHFTGFRNDVPWLLRELDLFLITSRTEGLGTSVLDAFACNVPVVATRAGGIPEIVHKDESGLLCPVGDDACLADAVLRVLGDADLRDRLTAGGRRVLAAHHPDAVAQATLAEYQAVLA